MENNVYYDNADNKVKAMQYHDYQGIENNADELIDNHFIYKSKHGYDGFLVKLTGTNCFAPIHDQDWIVYDGTNYSICTDAEFKHKYWVSPHELSTNQHDQDIVNKLLNSSFVSNKVKQMSDDINNLSDYLQAMKENDDEFSDKEKLIKKAHGLGEFLELNADNSDYDYLENIPDHEIIMLIDWWSKNQDLADDCYAIHIFPNQDDGFLIKEDDEYSLGYLTDSGNVQDSFNSDEIEQMKADDSLRAFNFDNAVITPYREALNEVNDDGY